MIRRQTAAASLAVLLLASACDRGGSVPETNNAMNAAAPVNDSAAAGNAATPAPLTGALGAYVGKHPSEDVAGVSFLAQPSVKAAVAAAVPDAKVREFVFNYNGPDAPIASKDGRLLAWGCEAHNCGYHNWSVSITPDGTSADVCYYENNDSADGPARWYLASGTSEERPGNCPSE